MLLVKKGAMLSFRSLAISGWCEPPNIRPAIAKTCKHKSLVAFYNNEHGFLINQSRAEGRAIIAPSRV